MTNRLLKAGRVTYSKQVATFSDQTYVGKSDAIKMLTDSGRYATDRIDLAGISGYCYGLIVKG
jgi:hypothetical protein